MLTYIDVINQFYPNLKFTSYGDGIVYSDLKVSNGTVPPRSELDAKLKLIKQDLMWRKIQIERDRRKASGIYISSIAKWFHSDTSSRIQHLGLVMMGASMPNNIMWKTMDGSFIQMTPTLAVQVFQQIAYNDVVIFGVAEQHKMKMLLLDDAELYNFNNNSPAWPKAFGE